MAKIIFWLGVLLSTPAAAGWFGPSCDSDETKTALIEEIECVLTACRATQVTPSEIKTESLDELKAQTHDRIWDDARRTVGDNFEAQVAKESGMQLETVNQFYSAISDWQAEALFMTARSDVDILRSYEEQSDGGILTCTADFKFNDVNVRRGFAYMKLVMLYTEPSGRMMAMAGIERGSGLPIGAQMTMLMEGLDAIASPSKVTFTVRLGREGLVVALPDEGLFH